MKLRDIKMRDDLELFYKEKNVSSDGEKIAKLKELMGIIAIRGEEGESEKQQLSGLEEIVLLGHWKALA